MGYHRAGFEVVGVDIMPHPNYPFEFHQADALTFPLDGFDAIHASPPCQAHSTLKHRTGKEYECFIERIRERLVAWGGPYVIENVMGAPLINPIRMCGSVFPELNVRRHRLFESNIALHDLGCCHKLQPEPIDVSGTGARRLGPRTDGKGGNSRKPRNLEEARAAMGIDWMTRRELSQSIPPVYTEVIGATLMLHLYHKARLCGPVRRPPRFCAERIYNDCVSAALAAGISWLNTFEVMSMYDKKERLIETVKYIREAKNNLVMAALCLDQTEGFDSTVAEIKENIGDLVCAEKLLDETIISI